MENNNTTTVTKTVTETKDTTLVNIPTHTVKAPIFILFAEYLGYVSELIPWAEEACKGEKIAKYKMMALETDAICLFKLMIKDYPIDKIINWYDGFYDVIFEDYDKTLDKINENK